MVKGFRYFVYTLLLLALSIPAVRADDHAAEGEGTKPAGDPALTANKLSPKELTQMVEGFASTEEFVKERWDTTLPAALDAARNDKKEEAVAGIFAKAVGLVNAEQLKKMGKDANDAAVKEESGNNRYGELLKHMVWTKEIFFPSEGKEREELKLKFKLDSAEFEAFKKEFIAKWNEQSKKNDDFYTLLKDASGDAGEKKDKAVADLRSKYDPKALLSFIDGQGKTGNKDLADKLGNALAFHEGDTSFIDAINKGGDKVRIKFDKNTGPSQALAKFAQETNTPVSQLTFSKDKFDKPGITFTPGKPIEKDAAATKVTPASAATPPTPRGGDDNKPKAEVDNSTSKAVAALGLMTDNCASCHEGEKPKGGFKLSDFIKNPTKATLKTIFDEVDSGNMPQAKKGQTLDQKVVAKIKESVTEWAKENGLK